MSGLVQLQGRGASLIILAAIAIHTTWAILMAINPVVVNVTPLAPVYLYIHPIPLLIFILLSTSIAGLWGVFTKHIWLILLLIPQQIIMMMTAAGVAAAIYVQHYADGVVRPWEFIAADQTYYIWIAVAHTAALVIHAYSMAKEPYR